MSLSREQKFQALYAIHSGQMRLTDLRTLHRVGYVAATDEYSSKQDQKDVLGTKARLDNLMRLAQTRDTAKARVLLRLKPKPNMTGNRADAISRFATGFKGANNWQRYPPIPTRTPPSPTRPGSSKGKIGQTRYIGFGKLNKDLDAMTKALLKVTGTKGVTGKDVASKLKKVKMNLRATVKGG